MSDGFDVESESARLHNRDPAAWESFYERVYPRMLAYAERRLGRGEAARDAVSEALARTVKTVARMEELDATPEAWCFGILRHVVVDNQRHIYRDRTVVEPYQDSSPDPTANLEVSMEHESVRRAFAQLNDADRELLELRVVAGLSSDEVAKLLSMQPSAVRMAQKRALEKLRSLMMEVIVRG
ncbi:MAG: sigma-70 family RNA polymerase sigma factor [Acidimicrobiales bacterium]